MKKHPRQGIQHIVEHVERRIKVEYFEGKVPAIMIRFILVEAFAYIRDSVLSGIAFELRCFGVFSRRTVEKCDNRHDPRTGEPVETVKRIKVHFRPGAQAKRIVD